MAEATSPLFEVLRQYLASDYPNLEGWYDAYCPFHSDSKRSAGFNFERNRWICHAGCGKGTLDVLADKLAQDQVNDEPANQTPFDEADVIDIRTRTKEAKRLPLPDSDTIDGWSRALLNSKTLLEPLLARGLTVATLREYRLGWCSQQKGYTIPMWQGDELLNVKFRSPYNDTKTKMWWWPGYSGKLIYPFHVLGAKHIAIVEGELDALIANQNGIPAVTGTAGAATWHDSYNNLFLDKTISVIYDRDKAGEEGAEKVQRALAGVASSINVVTLPMDYRERGGLDLTDYFRSGGLVDTLRMLMNEVELVTLAESITARNVGVATTFPAIVSGKRTTDWLLPERISYTCNQDAGNICEGCIMQTAGGSLESVIPAGDVVNLKLIDVPEATIQKELHRYCGAHACKKLHIEMSDPRVAGILTLKPPLDMNDAQSNSSISRIVLNTSGYSTEASTSITVTATTYPDPHTQEVMGVAHKIVPSSVGLEGTGIDPEELEEFRPGKTQTPLEKVTEVANSLSESVTNILGRPTMHIAMMLTWHSVLAFNFGNTAVNKGWLDVLVVGDSRTGKSAAAKALATHYNLGQIISCETASFAGILGGAKQIGRKQEWMIEWGVIPLHDRRMVILDESGGLTTNEISSLSSARSSGIAEINKIQFESRPARTRLLWISNPREGKSMRSFRYGVEAIQPLIGNLEDIARFDLALTLREDNFNSDIINQIRPIVDTPYTTRLCRELVRWVWNLAQRDVVWGKSAVDRVLSAARMMGNKYAPSPPLVQSQDVRNKIARIAAALAGATFSSTRDYKRLLITPRHVEGAIDFLQDIYDSHEFGYRDISLLYQARQQAATDSEALVKAYLQKMPYLPDVLRHTPVFDTKKLSELLGMPYEATIGHIAFLARHRMIEEEAAYPNQTQYRTTMFLNTILKELV